MEYWHIPVFLIFYTWVIINLSVIFSRYFCCKLLLSFVFQLRDVELEAALHFLDDIGVKHDKTGQGI